MTARGLVAETMRRNAWIIWELGLRVQLLSERVSRVIASASEAVDPDDEPCRECHEPGGTHYDCDMPAGGRMTASERRDAYAEQQR